MPVLESPSFWSNPVTDFQKQGPSDPFPRNDFLRSWKVFDFSSEMFVVYLRPAFVRPSPEFLES